MSVNACYKLWCISHIRQRLTNSINLPMDVFDLNQSVLQQYQKFARSFTKIKSEELKKKVDALYETNRFWPDPLIQLNPHYATGGSVQEFVDAGVLEDECSRYFIDPNSSASTMDRTIKLYKHQQQSVTYGVQGKSFVVTTGTGSGKSLCYFIPIINAAVKGRKAGESAKTRAIVIYPMNALANSQKEELRRYLGSSASRDNPTYARYTGQENSEERRQIRDNPPDILLTNFMMLELLMTRQNSRDKQVLANCRNLEFIVLDELHSYRGRQGADIAMLMRRLRARVGDPNHPPVCIGTSATMASEGDSHEKTDAVSKISTQMFGVSIGRDAVITETLKRVTDSTKSAKDSHLGLADAIDNILGGQAGYGLSNSKLASNDLAIWIETEIGLEHVDQKPERAKPVPFGVVAERLSGASGRPIGECEEALKRALIDFSMTEKQRGIKFGSNSPLFAFKLHQFISGAGRLYSTLSMEGNRSVSFSGQIFNPSNADERLYPTHFCRSCGQEFHPVTLRTQDGCQYFEKREIDDIPVEPDEADEGVEWGYLMPEPQDDEFNFTGNVDDYPETWVEVKGGNRKLKYYFRKRRAKLFIVAPNGIVEPGKEGRRVWFTAGKFRFCPTCLNIPTPQARETNKLASLAAEGRSSATTMLVSKILHWMNSNMSELESHTRKILAFTDNRQDAALQAGHFNDFIFVSLFRAAILKALKSAPDGSLLEPEMGARIQNALGFRAAPQFTDRADEWLINPNLKGQAREDVESTLRESLQHRFWVDQRRGWRYTSPNLEQLGLVCASYDYLDQIIFDDEEFRNSNVLESARPQERKAAFIILFDHMRKGLAVNSQVLERQKIENLIQRMRSSIAAPWALSDEALIGSTFLMLKPPHKSRISRRDEDRILRGTPRSALAKKIRELKFNGRLIEPKDIECILSTLLNAAKNYGVVEEVFSPFEELGWRLQAKIIHYHLQDDQAEAEVSNSYFLKFYEQIASSLTDEMVTYLGFEGREHTAQVDQELRRLREWRFRFGTEEQIKLDEHRFSESQIQERLRFLPILFCSPTMELGVDISSMNVVYLRNSPPTAANYAQRSGRAGRSGQAALILSYCAAQSPHDQYFFERKEELVAGIMVPPSIDLRNRDLVESHLHAEWLAATEVELQSEIPSNLDMQRTERPLLKHLVDSINSKNSIELSSSRVKLVLDMLENDFGNEFPSWYQTQGQFVDTLISEAPYKFNAAFNRWRELLASAERTRDQANQTLADYSISSRERHAAQARQKMSNHQVGILLHSNSSKNHDFELYRYLATECFLPGYNFPRLPLMAYLPGASRREKSKYIQRARFLGISEFGPHSLVYHEGNTFRVNKALLKDAGSEDDGKLPTFHKAICENCGASHLGEHPESCHVCNAVLDDSVLIHNLHRVENVGTYAESRITSDDEDRRRQGFNIVTTFSFVNAREIVSRSANDDEGEVALLNFAQAALISRINKGRRKRNESSPVGFFINPKTGDWKSEPKDDQFDNGSKNPEVISQLIVPVVEDRKNALLLRFPRLIVSNFSMDYTKTIATIQHALARGIETYYQLEEGEILVEPTPDSNNRRALLFYESAEGGAGALIRMIEEEKGISEVARCSLKIMHYDENSFEDARNDVGKLVDSGKSECVAGCYRCILSYYNQPDHELIDRRDSGALSFLLRLAFANCVKDKDDSVSLLDSNGIPPPDAKPLEMNGMRFFKVWRKFRLVALDKDAVNEATREVLAAKGVRLIEIPSDPDGREKAEIQLRQAFQN